MAFLLHKIKPLKTQDQLHRGLYLLVVNVGNIPPHIMLMVGKELFALEMNRKIMGKPLAVMLGVLKKAKTPTVFIELNNQGIINPLDLKNMVLDLFSHMPVLMGSNLTCIKPIAAVFSSSNMIEGVSDEIILEDLLNKLNKKMHLGEVWQIGMDHLISPDKRYALPEYTFEDVVDYIGQLN